VIRERIQDRFEEASPVRHSADNGARPDDGPNPEGAHFLDASWEQHSPEQGPFDATTTPVPVDWYTHSESPQAVSAPAPATAAARSGDAPDPPERSRGHKRRGRARVLAWSLVGVVLVGGAGAAAAVVVAGSDDDPKDRASRVGTDLTPSPAAPTRATPSAKPTTRAPAPDAKPSSGEPSTSASASASASKSPSASASATKSSGPPRNDVDAPKDPSALKPAAYTAWRKIKTAMAADGITLQLESGKRSWAHQEELWEQEIENTGSRAAALRRVLPPEDSMHVKGYAIDIYPASAQTWLQREGSTYGWCRLYDNESWHFEYDASYKSGCPARKAGPWE